VAAGGGGLTAKGAEKGADWGNGKGLRIERRKAKGAMSCEPSRRDGHVPRPGTCHGGEDSRRLPPPARKARCERRKRSGVPWDAARFLRYVFTLTPARVAVRMARSRRRRTRRAPLPSSGTSRRGEREHNRVTVVFGGGGGPSRRGPSLEPVQRSGPRQNRTSIAHRYRRLRRRRRPRPPRPRSASVAGSGTSRICFLPVSFWKM